MITLPCLPGEGLTILSFCPQLSSSQRPGLETHCVGKISDIFAGKGIVLEGSLPSILSFHTQKLRPRQVMSPAGDLVSLTSEILNINSPPPKDQALPGLGQSQHPELTPSCMRCIKISVTGQNESQAPPLTPTMQFLCAKHYAKCFARVI